MVLVPAAWAGTARPAERTLAVIRLIVSCQLMRRLKVPELFIESISTPFAADGLVSTDAISVDREAMGSLFRPG